MASKELNSSDYIEHHLQNLTFGKCSDGKWRFADGHLNLGNNSAHKEYHEYTCDVKEMGFNAIHVDTMFMSLLLGAVVAFFFWSIAKKATSKKPSKLQNCFEGSILVVQKRFKCVTSAKLLWRKHICDQKGDLFYWDSHLVELTCMTRRHTDPRTSKFWGSLCKSPFGATLPCRCNLVK